MTSKKIVTFLYFFIFVSIGFFFAPFLKQKGMDEVVVGYLSTAGLSLMIFFYFIFGILADKWKATKPIIFCNLIITIIVFILLILSTNTYILSISYILSFSSFMVLTPIIDGYILNGIPKEKYTTIRKYGSLGAAFSYFINTYFLNSLFGYNTIIWIDVIFIMAIITILYTINSDYKIFKFEKQNMSDSLKTVVNNKQLLLIFILAFLSYGTLKADDPYQYQYYSEIALLTPATIGVVGFLSTFFEAFTINIYSFVKRQNQFLVLLIAIANLFIIDFIRYAFYDIQILVILAYIFVGFYIGLFIPVAITIINESSTKQIKNTMLSIYQVSISLGGIILGFITTTYYAFNNTLQNIYLLHSFIIIIALLVLITFKSNFSKKEKH